MYVLYALCCMTNGLQKTTKTGGHLYFEPTRVTYCMLDKIRRFAKYCEDNLNF